MAKTMKVDAAATTVVKGNSGSKKTRKSSASRVARNERYKSSDRRNVNKAIKLAKHKAVHILDDCAQQAWDRLTQTARATASKVLKERGVKAFDVV